MKQAPASLFLSPKLVRPLHGIAASFVADHAAWVTVSKMFRFGFRLAAKENRSVLRSVIRSLAAPYEIIFF
jgi:hypothetical protein